MPGPKYVQSFMCVTVMEPFENRQWDYSAKCEIDSRQQSIDMLLDVCKLLLEAIRDSYEEGYYTAAHCNTDAARYSDDVQSALAKANEIMAKVRSK